MFPTRRENSHSDRFFGSSAGESGILRSTVKILKCYGLTVIDYSASNNTDSDGDFRTDIDLTVRSPHDQIHSVYITLGDDAVVPHLVDIKQGPSCGLVGQILNDLSEEFSGDRLKTKIRRQHNNIRVVTPSGLTALIRLPHYPEGTSDDRLAEHQRRYALLGGAIGRGVVGLVKEGLPVSFGQITSGISQVSEYVVSGIPECDGTRLSPVLNCDPIASTLSFIIGEKPISTCIEVCAACTNQCCNCRVAPHRYRDNAAAILDLFSDISDDYITHIIFNRRGADKGVITYRTVDRSSADVSESAISAYGNVHYLKSAYLNIEVLSGFTAVLQSGLFNTEFGDSKKILEYLETAPEAP